MERERVIRLLESAGEAKAQIRRHRDRIRELEARATRVTAQLGGTPAGQGGGRERLLAALADERDMESAAEIRAMERYRAVRDAISRMESPLDREILRLKYLDGKRHAKQIQRGLRVCGWYYTERHVARLVDSAEKKMSEMSDLVW